MGRVVVIVALALGLLAAPAHAYKLRGKPWPGRTITYHSSAPRWDGAIRDAARAWNTSGVRIRFKAATRGRAALRIVPEGPVKGIAGNATLGYVPRDAITRKGYIREPTTGLYMDVGISGPFPLPCGHRMRVPGMGSYTVRCFRGPHVFLQRPSRADLRDPATRVFMRVTAAHELGHVLGLHHVPQSTCALMTPAHPNDCPDPPNPWDLRCRLIEADDLRGALKRYGGSARPLAPEFCPGYAPPLPPTGLAVAYDTATETATVTWANASFPRRDTTYVALGEGACPAPDDFAYRVGARAERFDISPGAGHHCVAVFSRDEFGRFSEPATAWLDVP